MEQLINEIIQGQMVRQNLSSLRQVVKDSTNQEIMKELIIQNKETMLALLWHEDAKTRKNALLLFSDLSILEFVDTIIEQYQKEDQLFVRSIYPKALQSFNCSNYIEQLKQIKESLESVELTDNNKKHIQMEIKELHKLLFDYQDQTHTFIGDHLEYTCIALCNKENKNFIEETIMNQKIGVIKPYSMGCKVVTKKLEQLRTCRFIKEILFELTKEPIPCDSNIVATKIIEDGFVSWLQRIHDASNQPFYFRIELKSKKSVFEKNQFVRKVATQLEQQSNFVLRNATTNYDIEIRLFETSEGFVAPLIRLCTLEDTRFDYRQEFMPTSIKPSNAALLVALSKEYMIDNARVLDPFCGVGTMLIERQKVMKANTSYGIDYNQEAIDKAKMNTGLAGQIIHYINRDFNTFKHEYLFDEIFTNMPFALGNKTQDEIETTYHQFFKKAPSLLEDDGMVFLYSRDYKLVCHQDRKYGYTILKKFLINKKEDSWLFILCFE